jgi:predicted component of type VI protein secretion system
VLENEYLGKRVRFDFTDISIPHLPCLSLCHLLTKQKEPRLPLTLSDGIIPPHRGSGQAESDRYVPLLSSLIHALRKRAGLGLLMVLLGEFCYYFLERGDEFWEEAKTSTVFVVSVSRNGLLNC